MRGFGRWTKRAAALGVVVAGALSGSLSPMVAQAATVYRIGVDNSGPRNHNFEYVDYFPRRGLRAHVGDVIDFNWNTGSLDGLHTATLVPANAAVPPLVIPDVDDPGGQLEFNPAVLAPSDPTCGSNTNPCVYDGTKLLNSGAIANAGGGDFFVKLKPTLTNNQPQTVTFLCEIHPGMQGSLTVVSNRAEASEPEDVRERAADQLQDDTEGALRAVERAERTSVQLNPDGKTRTITMTAGTATQFVEVAEMLPRNITVRPGDSVNWITRTLKDPHTVTFPSGSGSDSVDPLSSVCEGPTDKPAVAPTDCASPVLFELHLNPQPVGGTVISSVKTVATSGIIANSATTPFPNHYTFTFPNAGTFDYQCRIHDHMMGTAFVRI